MAPLHIGELVSSRSSPPASRSAIAARLADRTQRAASSIANGTPATSRQTSGSLRVSGREAGPQQAGPLLEQLHRLVAGRSAPAPAGGQGRPEHLDQPLDAQPEPPPRGHQHLHPRRPAQQLGQGPGGDRGAARGCPAPAAARGRPGGRRAAPADRRGTASDTPRAWAMSATTARSAASSGRAGLVPTNDTNTVPSPWRPSRAAALAAASRVLPMPPGADQGHQPAGGVVEQLVQAGQLLFPADQRGEWPGQVGRGRRDLGHRRRSGVGLRRASSSRSGPPGGRRWPVAQLGEPAGVGDLLAQGDGGHRQLDPQLLLQHIPAGLVLGQGGAALAAAGGNHMSARWASSWSGSSSSMRRATSTPVALSPRSQAAGPRGP